MPGGQRGLQSAGVFVMLTILFKILSILGIVLLILLGIALVVIALVLFFPIFYKAEGKKNSEELWLTVRAKWLFGLLRCFYDYPDPGKLQVKLLFSTLYDSSVEKPQKDTDASEDAPTEETAEAAAAVAEVTLVAEPRETGPTQTATSVPPTADDPSDALFLSAEIPAAEKSTNKTADRLYRFFEKIRCTIRKICDKIKNILQNIAFYKELWQDPDTQGLLQHAGKRIGHILKRLRPRKLRINAVVGTGSPDTTGYLYGIYGMLLPKLGKGITITPDFEQAVLEGEFKASGHFTLACILFHSVRLILDKRLRKLQDSIKQSKKTQKK